MTAFATRRTLAFGIALGLGLALLCLWLTSNILVTLAILVGVSISAFIADDQERLLRSEIEAVEEQKELAERLAAEHRSAVDAFADGLDVGIFVCDERAHISYANLFAQRLFEFDKPAGRSVLAVTLSVDLEQLVLKAAETGEKEVGEFSFSFPKERVCSASAWVAGSGDPRVFLAILDVTDVRRLERVRRDFVANVSHELRTPMTVIRAFSETMLDDDDPELRQRYLNRIISEVDRLTSITQDLLVLSTSESSPVRKGRCDVGEIVQYALNLLEPQAKEKRLSLSFTGANSLEIEANSSQITQVVVNLIENAIKYTVEGGVAIRLEGDDQAMSLEITDTGVGIASEHLPRLFERFYRVDKGRSRTLGGTGLGLSIVKHIVEAHGGTVTVDSTLNEGSTFIVKLPLGDITDTPDSP